MKLSIFSKLSVPFFLVAALAFSASQAFAGESLASGEFVGASDHITTGKVTVQKIDSGFIVKLADDFSLDGAPEPSVGFGKNGEYDKSSDLGSLVMIAGAQTFLIPENVDYSQYNEIYIWCDKFSVPLGIAALN